MERSRLIPYLAFVKVQSGAAKASAVPARVRDETPVITAITTRNHVASGRMARCGDRSHGHRSSNMSAPADVTVVAVRCSGRAPTSLPGGVRSSGLLARARFRIDMTGRLPGGHVDCSATGHAYT
jgi:hypothetical protein